MAKRDQRGGVLRALWQNVTVDLEPTSRFGSGRADEADVKTTIALTEEPDERHRRIFERLEKRELVTVDNDSRLVRFYERFVLEPDTDGVYTFSITAPRFAELVGGGDGSPPTGAWTLRCRSKRT